MTPLPNIISAVCERFVVFDDGIMGRERGSEERCRARHVCWTIAHEAGYSKNQIAEYFGRDRTTVYAGIDRVRDESNLYPHIARAIEDVRAQLDTTK